MYRISEVSKMSNLSRSTLLYYDAIGLLLPSGRTEGNYRLYSEREISRLEKICLFRKAGIPLAEIKSILETEESSYTKILTDRFNQINEEIEVLKAQQVNIAKMLKSNEILDQRDMIDKSTWNRLMHSMGFDERGSRRWHGLFEEISPNEHTTFLKTLGFSQKEIEEIKGWSRK